MENSISSNLAQNGQKLIHSIQIKLRVGPAKSERIAVFSNIKFYIYQKSECKKSFLWIELSCIKVTDKDVTLKFGKNVFHIYPTDIKLFLSCIFDVIQRVLLPSELEKLDFYSFHSFIALPNPFSVSSRIRMKIEEKKMSYDRELVQPITDTLSYKRKDLNLSKFDSELLPFFVEAIPLYIGIRSIKIASSGKVDAYQYVSNLVLEKTNLRLIDVNGYSNANFEKYMANLSLNKSPKLLSLSFESSFFQESQLNLLKNMYKKSNLMGLEFHNAVSPQAFDFFHDSFFLSLNLKSLNLDGTRGINLPRILILLPGLVLLSLENCDLDISDVIIQIQNLQKLRSINLSGNRCTNYVKLRTQLPPNVLSVYANNVTWEKQCLVEFFKYRLMKLSISYISASSDEWQRLFDSLPDNQNNTLASIIWDGNNLHSNFFNYLKNQVCLNYLSLNDCFNQHHIDCLSYLTDYLKFQNSELDTFSLRGTESNNIGEYLPNILDIIMRNTKIHTLDVYGQRGGDQSIITIIENLGNMKVISCDKMNLTKGALLYDLAEKAYLYQVWLSYPSEDISMLVHTAKLSASDSKTLYNKFRMLPKRIKKQPPRVLYPPPSCSAFDFPFQVYKFYPENEFPRYLKEKQLAFYDRAPPMASVIPSIKLPNGQKQAVPSPQPSPQPSPPPLQQSQNQSSPKPSQVQTITTFAPPEHQSPSKYSNKPSPTFALGSPINDQLNQTYNRKSPSNYEMNQNFNRSSPSVSKNRQKMGNTSPNSMYKETVRPPPPRFIFEDDPITLEMSREDETILPTIDEEFFPANNNYNNNNYNNNYDKRHNNNYNNDKYSNYNDDNNNYDRYNNTKNLVNKSRFNNNRSQKQNYEEEQSQSRNRHRSNPSRNERSVSRSNKKVIERNEEEDFFDNNEYENDNQNVFRVSTRGRRYENENEDENEENLRRTSKSRQPQSRSRSSRPSRTNTTATTPSGGGNRRSTSRQRHNHRIRKNNNNNDYDYEDADRDEEFFDYDNEYDEENQQRRGRNSRSRKMSSTERARRNKPRFNNEDEESFDDINDDYDDQNELKNQSRRRKRTPTKGKVAIVSKTPSPYSRQRQTQSQRPRQSQSRQHQRQNQQSLSRSQHRRDQPSRNERNRIVEVDVNNDIEEYEEEEFNYSEDNLPNYKLKPQPQKRIRNVHQQQRQKQEQRGQSHRPRVQKPKNDQYDYDEDNDDDDRFYRQSSSRQQHQNRAQQSRSSRPVQKRSNDIPERKKQSIDRNHDASSRQQAHSRSRSRNNNQRMHNYNKDFDGDNYEDDNYVNNDDSQSYSVKRKGHSQRNPSRSSRQRSDHSHTQRIVRNINRNGSPKPSRRPAPKYVKNFLFSSADSYE